MTYREARDRLLAAVGWPDSKGVEFFEALSEFEQCVRLEERAQCEQYRMRLNYSGTANELLPWRRANG